MRVSAHFGVYVLCTCVYTSGGGSTCSNRFIGVCMPNARTSERRSTCLYWPVGVCTHLDMDPRACTSRLGCVRPIHMCTHLDLASRACIGPLGVYALCTCVYTSGRASTCLYLPAWLCTPCVHVCTRLKVCARACTCPVTGKMVRVNLVRPDQLGPWLGLRARG